jgi:hypothetical protein
MAKHKFNILLVSVLFAICGLTPAICCIIDECRLNDCSCPQTGFSKASNSLVQNKKNVKVSFAEKCLLNHSLQSVPVYAPVTFFNYPQDDNEFSSFYTHLQTIVILA